MPLIEIDHLVKSFGAIRAVDDLSFRIEEGTISGFLGPNGSGKTTTLAALLGLVRPTSGTATIDGRPYAELAHPTREVGAMLSSTFHPARTARDHLRVLAAQTGVPRSRVDELLRLVDLDGAADRKAGAFSLGMGQRLGLAGALIGDPRVLVLDEPANGLDPEGIRWLRDLLVSLAGEGRTILLSSHVLAEVAQTVDEVVVIRAGRLVVHTPLLELMDTQAGARVRVGADDPAALAAALEAAGVQVTREAEAVYAYGVDRDVVGRLSHESGIALTELASEASNLEDVFLGLTSAPAEVAA